jgi:hypothetical protein
MAIFNSYVKLPEGMDPSATSGSNIKIPTDFSRLQVACEKS